MGIRDAGEAQVSLKVIAGTNMKEEPAAMGAEGSEEGHGMAEVVEEAAGAVAVVAARAARGKAAMAESGVTT